MSDRTRPSRFAFAVAGLACLLAGCSGGETTAPSVATLRSEAPATASSRAADRRPVFPIDATEDDKAAMTKPWADCMVENGGPRFRNSAQELIVKGGITADDAKGRAALEICLPEQPEAFDEHQRRVDLTTYRDNQREWYQCAEAAGYQLTAPNPETGEFGLSAVGPHGDFGSPAIQECKRQAFTG